MIYYLFIFFSIFSQNYKIALVGYARENDGLGKITYSFYDTLSARFDVEFINSRPNEAVPKYFKIGSKNKYYDLVIFTDAIGYKNNFIANCMPDSKFKICYSMFESSQIPFEWVGYINSNFDTVLLPDDYLINVYKTSGVIKDIYVLEPGIKNIEDFMNYKKNKLCNNKFTFTYSSTFYERKNHFNLLQAFVLAFKNRDDVQLVLQGKNLNTPILKKIKKYIYDHQISNVILINEPLSREKYIKLIAESDCYVSVSKGEGFSISPRESLAAGVPTIVSNNTAQKTLCNSCKYIPINSLIKMQADYKMFFGRNIGCFFDININELAEKLREVFYNYDYCFNKAQLDRSWINFYREKDFSLRINKFINNYLI